MAAQQCVGGEVEGERNACRLQDFPRDEALSVSSVSHEPPPCPPGSRRDEEGPGCRNDLHTFPGAAMTSSHASRFSSASRKEQLERRGASASQKAVEECRMPSWRKDGWMDGVKKL